MDTDQTAGRQHTGDPAAEGPGPPPATPLVGLVLVAHDPGDWFEDVLAAIGAQDHSDLDVLVVDAGRRKGLAERVAAVLPWAEVTPAPGDPGFGAAANVAMGRTHGGAFHLFLHDDLVLDGTAVRRMVECALGSNAGIVGPKVLDGSDPRHLEDMGSWVDRYGAAVPRFEPGELDQGQYDADREVFATSESALLVRSDLFEAIGGFDPEIRFLDGSLDLCWRARLAGASVLTAPTAVGRSVGGRRTRRRRTDPQRLRPRHKLRMTLVNQDPVHRGTAVAELMLATLLGVAYGLLVGRFRHIRGLVAAWPWNLRRMASARSRRATVDHHFGGDQARLYVRHDVPHRSFHRAVTGGASVGTGSEAPGRLRLHQFWSALLGPGGIALLVGGAVLGFGSRHLLTRGLPAIGRFQAIPSEPFDLALSWWTGWRPTGGGIASPLNEGFALIGLAGQVFPWGGAVLLATAVLATFPIGAVGVWRLVRPIGGGRSRAVAVLTYLAVPLPYNSLAEGRLAPLAAYAALPWVAHRLAVAQGVVPYGRKGGDPGPGTRLGGLWGEALVTGLVLAVAIGMEPTVVVLAGVVATGLVVGSILAGSLAGISRLLLVATGATVVSALLHAHQLDRLPGGDHVAAFVEPGTWAPADLGIPTILRFDTGPFGGGHLGWALLVIPVLALLTASGWRLALVVRALIVAAGGFGLAWVLDQGWWSGSMPAAELVLVPAALGLAWAAAVGAASIGAGIYGRAFGWRHFLPPVAALALLVGVAPVVAASLDGRWGLPPRGLDAALPIFGDEGGVAYDGSRGGVGRVLWLGEPSILPAAGIALDDGLAMALTDGAPDLSDQVPFRASDGSGIREVRTAMLELLEGRTSRLGVEVADWGIQHLVVVERSAAAPYTAVEPPPPEELMAALTRQLDLERVEGLNRSVTVFRNTVAEPVHAVVRDRTGSAVPVAVERPAWDRFEVVPPVDGTFRAMVGPSGWWSLEPIEGAGSVEVVEGPFPSARIAAGTRAAIVMDAEVGSRGVRTRQSAIVVVVLLATSWAHVGRGRRRVDA